MPKLHTLLIERPYMLSILSGKGSRLMIVYFIPHLYLSQDQMTVGNESASLGPWRGKRVNGGGWASQFLSELQWDSTSGSLDSYRYPNIITLPAVYLTVSYHHMLEKKEKNSRSDTPWPNSKGRPANPRFHQKLHVIFINHLSINYIQVCLH